MHGVTHFYVLNFEKPRTEFAGEREKKNITALLQCSKYPINSGKEPVEKYLGKFNSFLYYSAQGRRQ